MNRFLASPFNRAMVLIGIAHPLAVAWLAPDLRRVAAAARAEDPPTWAVLLLIISLCLVAYGLLEAYLIHLLRDPPPRAAEPPPGGRSLPSSGR